MAAALNSSSPIRFATGAVCRIVMPVRNSVVQDRQRGRKQHQRAAREDQTQADQLVLEIVSILRTIPNAIQRHLQRLEDPAGGEKQQHQRNHLNRPSRRHGDFEIPADELPERIRKIVVQRKVDRAHAGSPLQNIPAYRKHHGEKRKEGQQQARRHRECEYVHLGLHQVAAGGQQCAADSSHFVHPAITRRPSIRQRPDRTIPIAAL